MAKQRVFKKLTRANIRKLRPGETLTEFGITYRKLDDGDGVFSVNIMVDGARIHRVIGRESDGVTRSTAEEFIAKARHDALRGRLALPKGRKVTVTFRDAAARYIEREKESGGKYLVDKERSLRMHLVPFFGDTPLSKISSFDIERYKKARQSARAHARPRGKRLVETKRAVAPATINRELAVLSHLFTRAVEWGWLTHRPARIRRFPEGKGRIEYLKADEVARLLECAKEDANPAIYPFIFIGVETAMRRAEILSIRKEHVDVHRRVIYIPKAKAGARTQPMTKRLAAFLADYIAALPPGVDYLFPSPQAASGHVTDIRKAFRRVVQAAGLNPDKVVRHTLRHTAITHLVQAGVDLPTVKRISGHKTLAMVERYAHANGAHIEDAMERLEKRLALASVAAASDDTITPKLHTAR